MGEQLALPRLRSARMPFSVRRRTIRRAVWRELAMHAEVALRQGFQVRPLVEDHMLLAELRVKAREMRRRAGTSAAAFASTLQGRRVHQLMAALSERIAARQEKILCG